MLGALSSCSTLPMLVSALFKKYGLFLNTPCIIHLELLLVHCNGDGSDSSVSIVTLYVDQWSVVKIPVRARFSTPIQSLRPTQPLV
jgi:hypothetical protein